MVVEDCLQVILWPSRPPRLSEVPGMLEFSDMYVRSFACQDVSDSTPASFALPIVGPYPT